MGEEDARPRSIGSLSHPVGDGVVPEAVETLQAAVHHLELVRIDPADLSIEPMWRS